MSASAPLFVRTYRIGRRYRATFSVPRVPGPDAVSSLLVEWEPNVPRRMTAREEAAYLRARDAVLREILEASGGGRALVVT